MSGADPTAAADAQQQLTDLAARGRQVASQISALQGELIDIAGAVRRLEGSLAGGTAREWIALEWGLTPAEAARTVRLAGRLSDLPELSAGLASGRLSEGTVDLLARVASPANEARLVETARVATGAQLRTLVGDMKHAAAAAAVAGGGPEPDRPDTFAWHIDETGRYRWRGSTSADLGAPIAAAIDAARQIDLDDAGAGAEPLTNAEAMSQVAETYLAGTAKADGVVPETYQAIVEIDESGAHLHDGGHLEPANANQLLCQAWIVAMVTRNGRPVTATSPTRLATPAQRRALIARDRCCQYPGCGRTRLLRAHHIWWSSQGGPTQLDNLVLLCPIHHRRIHRPGWVLQRRADGLQFRRPDGSLVTAQPRPPPRPDHPLPTIETRTPVARDYLTRFGRDVILHHWISAA